LPILFGFCALLARIIVIWLLFLRKRWKETNERRENMANQDSAQISSSWCVITG